MSLSEFAELPVLPLAGEAYMDVRDGGRSLRVAWHSPEPSGASPAEGFFVVSIWRDRTCVATFRLDRRSAEQLIGTLVTGLSATAGGNSRRS